MPDAMPSLESTIKTDLHIVESLLPPHIRSKLQSTTSIYVHLPKRNDSAIARYHSRDCNSKLFVGNITISAVHYLQNRCCWGDGAVLAHEFAHAVHEKLIPDGYACETIEKVRSIYTIFIFTRLKMPLNLAGFQRSVGGGTVSARLDAPHRWHEVRSRSASLHEPQRVFCRALDCLSLFCRPRNRV